MSPLPPSFYKELKQSIEDNSITDFLKDKELPKTVIDSVIRDHAGSIPPGLLVMRCKQYLNSHGQSTILSL